MGSFAGPNTVKDSLYNYHIATTSGTFTPNFTGNVEVLVVAGGGGGGMDMGGGGGGGGVLSSTSYAVTAGTGITVTVGAGGVGAPAGQVGGQSHSHQFTVSATQGGNSVFGSLTAIGGGYGGSSYFGYLPNYGSGGTGGSGGGASGYSDGNAGHNGTGTAGQGNAGGASGGQYYSGGGGGAGAVGASGTAQANGGAGILNSIIGKDLYWGGGGGGAAYSLATGGNGGIGGGGGGACGVTTGGLGFNNGEAGTSSINGTYGGGCGGNGGLNTGGGGGGGTHYNTNNGGGNGGSGIVVIRYLKSLGTSTFNSGSVENKSSLVLSLDAASVSKSSAVEVLVVAGGGGGGLDMGGGGGGGGVIYKNAYSVVTNVPITVTIGAGGAGSSGTYAANPNAGSSGGNTIFGSITTIGGGGGGSGHYYPAPYAGQQGQPGGCGGGDSPLWGRNRFPYGGAGIAGQGFGGGAAGYAADGNYTAGGGGGATSRGAGGGNYYTAGNGGTGLYSAINGTGYYWGGGGGGAAHGGVAGNGGLGGGGGGSAYAGYTLGSGAAGLNSGGNGVAATSGNGGNGGTNTGGGGGGGSHWASIGGAGGSGIVIVRYYGAQKATGGTVTSSNGYTIHTFTSSGTFTPTGFLDLGDSTGSQNKGTVVGATYSSNNGGCLIFDGSDDYVETPSLNVDTSNEFTLEAFVKFNSVSGNQSIIKKNTSNDNWPIFSLSLSGQNLYGYYSSPTYGQCLEGANTTNNPIIANVWYHLVFSKGASGYTSMKMHINGVSVPYSNYLYGGHINAIANSTRPVHIGRNLDGSTWVAPINGSIAVTRIYNRQLSDVEVKQNFQALRGRFGI